MVTISDAGEGGARKVDGRGVWCREERGTSRMQVEGEGGWQEGTRERWAQRRVGELVEVWKEHREHLEEGDEGKRRGWKRRRVVGYEENKWRVFTGQMEDEMDFLCVIHNLSTLPKWYVSLFY